MARSKFVSTVTGGRAKGSSAGVSPCARSGGRRADDDDAAAADIAEAGADGVQVEEGLGGVGVPAVAAVDDAHLYVARHQVWCAGGAVANDEDVRADGLEGADGIDEGFALLHAGCRGGDVDYVRAKGLPGKLKGGAGAGAGLVEEGDDRLAAERGDAGHVAGRDLPHGVGRGQDRVDVIGGEVVEVKDVLAGPGGLVLEGGRRAGGDLLFGHRSPSAGITSTSSRSSVSSRRTWTSWSSEVGMFLPT
jgi:hypothetical protein